MENNSFFPPYFTSDIILQIHSYCIFQLLKYSSKLQAMAHFTEQVVIIQQYIFFKRWGFFLAVQEMGILKQPFKILAANSY